MPTYVYECEDGHEFEVEQRITAEPLKLCEKLLEVKLAVSPPHHHPTVMCHAPCQRVLQPAAIKLKGGGWARDGYGG